MQLILLDWIFVFGFFAVALAIGLSCARLAGHNSSEFFLSGRNMPWWLLGTSMVATTFSTDTPNLVTDIVYGPDSNRPDWMRKSQTYPLLNASGRAVVDWVETRRKGSERLEEAQNLESNE